MGERIWVVQQDLAPNGGEGEAGVNIETIRYYERVGLMPKPPRSEGGHRVYDRTHKQRLIFIRRARKLGFSLDDIRICSVWRAAGALYAMK